MGLRGALPASWVEPIAAHLESGRIVAVAPGFSRDVLEPSTIIGPLRSLTDGEWSWMSDLPYYVRRYRVGLGAAFLSSLRAKGVIA